MADKDSIRRALQAGRPVADAAFDARLPDPLRRISYRFWTPLVVCRQVTDWFADIGAERVLDVGSGAGKFCVAGALSSGLQFTGLEHRRHLVEAAETLAVDFEVSDRVTFQEGGLDDLPFAGFDALYFYNPFGEHRFPVADHLDHSVEINRRRFDREVSEVERRLARMPLGTGIVTYNGYGGRLPDTYDLHAARMAAGSPLRFWVKGRSASRGAHWLELEDTTVLREPDGREDSHPVEPDPEV